MTDVKQIGVIGAGQMGNGIAHVFAAAGYEVLLNDIDAERLKAALAKIDKNLARQVSKEKLSPKDAEAALKRIKPSNDLAGLSSCDLVIESASENLALKKEIFTSLSKTLKKDAIMASNTSSMSITGLAASTDRPEKFIGIHFMNPAPLMRLVEVIRGIATSKETFDTTKGLIERPRQGHGGLGRLSRFHRQSRIDAHDQRGDLHACMKGWAPSKRSTPA